MHERIKKLRKALDLTQQEFASRIGTSANVLTNYETGRRNPSSSVINNICKTFNVNEHWLRTGEGEMFVQQSKEAELSAAVNRLLSGESSEFKRRLIVVLSRLDIQEWELLEMRLNEITGAKAETAQPVQQNRDLTLEQEADAFAAQARKQFLDEKKRASQTFSAKESDAV